MSKSLDILKNIIAFYFCCKIQVLYIQMRSASQTSIITGLNYQNFTFSIKWQPWIFVLYTPFQVRERFGQCRTICGPEYQRTFVIVYSCFCLLYVCFSSMRRTWLCWHHCFKFRGNDRLRNRDGCVGTCFWTLVTGKVDFGTGRLGSSRYFL